MARTSLVVAVALFLASLAGREVQAAMMPGAVSGVTGTGHGQGDSANGDGSIRTTLDGTGLSFDAGDNRFEHSNRWQDDWQGAFSGGTPADAAKGWLVLDLQQVYPNLVEMWIWNVNENGHPDRGTQDFDIYYATTLSSGVPATGTVPYDFTDPGWTKLNSASLTLAPGSGASGLPVSGIFDLGGIPQAQYLGLDILSDYGSDFRVGFAEIQLFVPEPSTLVMLLGLSGVGLLGWIRRRRRS